MVKKSSKFLIPYILLIAFVLLLLGGCSDLFGASGTSAGKIIPPSDSTCPFPGKWTVLEELGLDEDPESTESQWEGKSMQFAEDCVAIDDAVWTNISYKIKRVDAADYLELKLVSYSDLILEKQQVEVVTVYADGNYLGEAMRADDSGMVFFAQDRGLLLIKVSDEADIMLDSSVSDGAEPDTEQESKCLRSPFRSADTRRNRFCILVHFGSPRIVERCIRYSCLRVCFSHGPAASGNSMPGIFSLKD
ncbi:MAG: hypothetical protein ACOX4J_02525 [Anaerovoracaceae bacterium]